MPTENTPTEANSLLDYSLLQSVAECYLDQALGEKEKKGPGEKGAVAN